MRLSPAGAFDVCQEVFAAAREVVDSRMPTLQIATASKFLWRPDVRPRLVEYVADFKLAGEFALGARKKTGSRSRGPGDARASRLILFRMYYVGGADYHAARRALGISEITWADWAEEIRNRVGRELIRRGLFPPGRYFKQHSFATRRGNEGAVPADS